MSQAAAAVGRLLGCGVAAIVLLTLLVAGCNSSQPAAPPPKEDAEAAAEPVGVKRVPASRFVWSGAVEKPDMDGGRVDLLLPPGWQLGPYDPDYLIILHRGSRLPRIFVSARFVPEGQAETITEENLEAFAEQIKQELDSEEVRLIEPVLPMVIGQRPCVRYVRGGRIGADQVDRQLLVTHVNGRRYTIELRVPKGAEQILKYRDDAYGLLATMKFTDIRQPKGEEGPTSGAQPPAAENQPEADVPAPAKQPEKPSAKGPAATGDPSSEPQ